MPRHINADGLAKLKQWEGLRLVAYQDSGGVWTIGYGHTSAAGDPFVTSAMRITEEEAERILRHDLGPAELIVERSVKVALSDNQFAALVSFAFNVGITAFKGSTLLKKLNAGNFAAVPGELAKWNKVKGKANRGLANRRAAEAGLWAKGEPVASQYVEAETTKVNALVTPEALAGGGSIVTAGLAAAANPGPLQIAMAFAVVVLVLLGAWYFVHRVREANA